MHDNIMPRHVREASRNLRFFSVVLLHSAYRPAHSYSLRRSNLITSRGDGVKSVKSGGPTAAAR
jgi:hypothetical protein